MRTGNKSVRDKAIPFISNPVSGSDETWGYPIMSNPASLETGNTIAFPMTQPEKGDIVEAYLYIEMTAPSDKPLNVRVGIGEFEDVAAGATITPVANYLEAYISREHRKIAGTESPYNAAADQKLYIDADLTRSLKKRGEAGFLSDAFVLIVTFDSLPDSFNGYSFDKFKLSCTAQMGFGT